MPFMLADFVLYCSPRSSHLALALFTPDRRWIDFFFTNDNDVFSVLVLVALISSLRQPVVQPDRCPAQAIESIITPQ